MNPIIKPTSISIKPTFNQSLLLSATFGKCDMVESSRPQIVKCDMVESSRPQIVKKWVAAFRDGHRLELTIIEAYVNDSIAAKLYGRRRWRIHSSGRPIWDTDDNLG
jgi:hypothetical protein